MRLNMSLRGNAISGCIAALIYFVIDLATGGDIAPAIIEAAIIGIVVFAISFMISRAIIASKRRHP